MAAMQHDGGGGGGSSHSLATQRELNALLSLSDSTGVRQMAGRWSSTGRRAHQIADLIEAKLADLTAEGGWTGSGATAFAEAIRSDALAPLRNYARRAAGVTDQGEQNVSHAKDLEPIAEAISGANQTASQNNIPWDVDTRWDARQKDVEQSLLSKIDELLTGQDEAYEKAKANSPYEIVNGNEQVVKQVAKTEFEPIESSIPAAPASRYFDKAQVCVDPTVMRFDLLMRRLDIGTAPRQSVQNGVDGVESALRSYAPQQTEQQQESDKGKRAGAGGPSGGGGGNLPGGGTGGGGGSVNLPDGNGGGGPDTGGGTDLPGDNRGPDGPGFEEPDVDDPDLGNGGDDTPRELPDGPKVGIDDPCPPGPGGDLDLPKAEPLPGDDDLTGGLDKGTRGAGTPGPGAVGGPAPVGGPTPAPTVGAGAGAGVGGLGNLGGSLNPGNPGTSFSLGANGRPQFNLGATSPLPGAGAGAGAGAGTGAGAGAGAGAGGSGAGMPMARPAGRRSDDEEESAELEGDETWLEEDQSVWGNRAAAPPAEIR